MRTSIPPAVRQLEKLLLEKFIPWSQSGAPLIYLGLPPRSALPLAIREEESTPLPAIRATPGYHKGYYWRPEKVNAVEIPIIGCVLEGQVNYHVHSAPGQAGKQWIVPVRQGTMFFIPPGTPFSDGSNPPPDAPYGRGMLIYLRRDGIMCHSYTTDKGKLWLHPYTFLHEPDALLPGDRLIREMEELNGPPDAVIYHYLGLILSLMLRCIRRGNFSTLKVPRYPELSENDSPTHSSRLPEHLVDFATEYIDQNLADTTLTIKVVAQHVSLSQGHLNRLFRQKKGMTVLAYLQAERFKRATHMLARSPLPIARIAGMCGFNDQSHFSHWFTRRANCSPTTYRHRHAKGRQKTDVQE